MEKLLSYLKGQEHWLIGIALGLTVYFFFLPVAAQVVVNWVVGVYLGLGALLAIRYILFDCPDRGKNHWLDITAEFVYLTTKWGPILGWGILAWLATRRIDGNETDRY